MRLWFSSLNLTLSSANTFIGNITRLLTSYPRRPQHNPKDYGWYKNMEQSNISTTIGHTSTNLILGGTRHKIYDGHNRSVFLYMYIFIMLIYLFAKTLNTLCGEYVQHSNGYGFSTYILFWQLWAWFRPAVMHMPMTSTTCNFSN